MAIMHRRYEFRQVDLEFIFVVVLVPSDLVSDLLQVSVEVDTRDQVSLWGVFEVIDCTLPLPECMQTVD